MPDPSPPDLFAAAGLVLDVPAAKPKRPGKPAPPSPAKRAAAERLQGGRRSRQALRGRVGPARQLDPGDVLPFPLARNVRAVADIVARLPHGYAPDLNRRRNQEVTRLQKILTEQGVSKQSAWLCARELVHVAYIQCVNQAHKEAGIL